jgi:hypothetical protein
VCVSIYFYFITFQKQRYSAYANLLQTRVLETQQSKPSGSTQPQDLAPPKPDYVDFALRLSQSSSGDEDVAMTDNEVEHTRHNGGGGDMVNLDFIFIL